MKANELALVFYHEGEAIKDADFGQVEFEVYTKESGYRDEGWKQLGDLDDTEHQLLMERLIKYDDYFKLALIQAWEYS